MTARQLVQAIEARYVALCRDLVRLERVYSDRLAYEALRAAVDEHAGELRRHPAIADQYTVDLANLAPETERAS